jgi:hypothetical protein
VHVDGGLSYTIDVVDDTPRPDACTQDVTQVHVGD